AGAARATRGGMAESKSAARDLVVRLARIEPAASCPAGTRRVPVAVRALRGRQRSAILHAGQTMRCRLAIRVGMDVPETAALNVWVAVGRVRPWRTDYSWPPAYSRGDERAHAGNVRGEIDARDRAEAELIVRQGLDAARSERDEVAATGSRIWPGMLPGV